MKLLAPLVALALILGAPATIAGSLQGKVIGVADGDTLTILDAKQQHRIRLAEIDAPESKQPFGTRSKQLLSEMCFGKHAEVRNTSADRYKRVVGTVYCNGVDANAELVRQGMAWVYVQYARRGSPLFNLETDARAAERGLWSDANAVPPWEWRRGSRRVTATRAHVTSAGGEIRGNRRSNVYHMPHCPSYEAVSPRNRVSFESEQKAAAAGYRRAGNCR